MRKTIRLFAVLTGIAAATAFGSQFAQAHEGKDGKECCCHARMEKGGQHPRFEKMAAKLGLSEQQKVKIKDLWKQNRQQSEAIRARLVTGHRNLWTLIHADKTDEAAIRAEAAKLAAAEGDMALQRAKMHKQMLAILTPEQVVKFKAMQKDREHKFGEYGHRHGGKHEHSDKHMDKPGAEQ